MSQKSRIIIIGGGFAGITAAKSLLKQRLAVSLITKEEFFTFLPLLPELATGHLPESAVKFYYRDFLPQINLIVSRVEAVDLERKLIATDKDNWPYDYLLITTGSVSRDADILGAAHCHKLNSLTDAQNWRMALEQLIAAGRPAKISVIGGGATGLELVLETAAKLKRAGSKNLELSLFHRSEQLVNWLPLEVNQRIIKIVEQAGIKLYLKTEIINIESGLVASDKYSWPSDLTLVAVGVKPVTEILSKRLLNQRSEVMVNQYLQIKGEERVFAAGDIIILGQTSVPALAQTAVSQGRLAAKNILAQIKNNLKKPYQPKIKGLFISLGPGLAVGRMGQRIFYGSWVWFLWRTIYWFNLPNNQSRWRAARLWTKSLLGR